MKTKTRRRKLAAAAARQHGSSSIARRVRPHGKLIAAAKRAAAGKAGAKIGFLVGDPATEKTKLPRELLERIAARLGAAA